MKHWNAEALSNTEIEDRLALSEPGDRLLLQIIRALRVSAEVEVEEAGGVGPDQAVAVIHIDGRRMRITAEPH